MGATAEAAFHAAISASALIFNATESSLLRTTHLWWVLLSISVVAVHVRVYHDTFARAPQPSRHDAIEDQQKPVGAAA
jgi:hypothetical protein